MLVAQNSLGPVCPVPLTVRGSLLPADGRRAVARRGRGSALSASVADAVDARADVRDLAGLDLLLLAVEAREGRLLTELYCFTCRLRRLLGRLRRRDGVHDSKIIVHPESIEDEAQSLDSAVNAVTKSRASWRFTASSLEMLQGLGVDCLRLR